MIWCAVDFGVVLDLVELVKVLWTSAPAVYEGMFYLLCVCVVDPFVLCVLSFIYLLWFLSGLEYEKLKSW